MVNDAPRFEPTEAARIAREVFGIDATVEPLPSERDQNFLITSDTGHRHVLKVANAGESRDMLEAQQAVMAHLASRTTLCPRPIVTRDGATTATTRGQDGREHFVWAVTHLP